MSTVLLEKQPCRGDEPVFDAPWQARTFAMAVKLHESGLFSWAEWAGRLSANIAAAEVASESGVAIESSDDYYTLWQHTLESLVADKS